MTKEEECLRALNALYLEVHESIANDIRQKVLDALTEVKIQTIAEHEAKREQDYPDIEADGFVFCGKCGKMKGV